MSDRMALPAFTAMTQTQLTAMLGKGDTFVSQDLQSSTLFGDYRVEGAVMNVRSDGTACFYRDDANTTYCDVGQGRHLCFAGFAEQHAVRRLPRGGCGDECPIGWHCLLLPR